MAMIIFSLFVDRCRAVFIDICQQIKQKQPENLDKLYAITPRNNLKTQQVVNNFFSPRLLEYRIGECF
jgi:hypothetical protein